MLRRRAWGMLWSFLHRNHDVNVFTVAFVSFSRLIPRCNMGHCVRTLERGMIHAPPFYWHCPTAPENKRKTKQAPERNTLAHNSAPQQNTVIVTTIF